MVEFEHIRPPSLASYRWSLYLGLYHFNLSHHSADDVDNTSEAEIALSTNPNGEEDVAFWCTDKLRSNVSNIMWLTNDTIRNIIFKVRAINYCPFYTFTFTQRLP